ncbi:2-oxoacid:acceptor oxidoreductase subunit alpha [Oleidesulfovibrio sp.]|uniref:2-oxoacid:acceptor oxidoreductase subunit alpha n=1 Tax=Oleidesulfovibrio sp. TaxID=2909707 RepID=UPI003A8BD0FE
MSNKDKYIVIGGEAGQGLVTIGQMLTKALARSGYEILIAQHYMSRVRGGHNTYRIRTGVGEIVSPVDDIDILVALNQETVSLHKKNVNDNGIVILDESLDSEGLKAIKVPFSKLAPRPIYQNISGLAVLGELLGIESDVLQTLVKNTFMKKGDEVVAQNLEVLTESCRWAGDFKTSCTPLPAPEGNKNRIVIHGNEAIALGALAAGVKCCFFYPMTPATSVAQNLITYAKQMKVLVEQAEDEIAALNMGLGSVYAGAKTLVPTSGGGFALMTEAVSLAGVMESPIVIVVAQRPGPATGLPTRTEQADLNLVLYAGHGEFPRAIFAPATIEGCFELTYKSFDVTERYQTPAFVLTDQFLADSYRAVEKFDLNALSPVSEPDMSQNGDRNYKRYAYSDDGVSPRKVPGFSKSLVLADCHEHTEDGHITESMEVRVAMNDKRMKKEEGMRATAIPPRYYGDKNASRILISWGSSEGPVREAAARMRKKGKSVGVLSFTQVWPLNSEQFLSVLEAADEVIGVEGNATAQFMRLLRQETGFNVHKKVLRYDGRPFTPRYILQQLGEQEG